MLRLPFTDISAFDMENGTVINPLNYGCNLKIRNTDREAYLAIPANETLEGLYLRIYEPIVTRMGGLTSLTGRFIVGNDTYSNPIIVNKITPKANTLCEMLCISTDNINYSWQIVNTDTCDF